jgi:hypothetical protein
VPWLATAALVHGMFLQRARKRHRRVNLLLACFAYVTILYGTFLTRSGILADFSVHSFIDLGITGWLVAILLGFLVLSLALVAWRWREIPVEADEETPALSRAVLFVLGIASFCALAFVILLGTSAPLLTRLSGNPSQVQNSFYGRTTTPGRRSDRRARGPRGLRLLEGRLVARRPRELTALSDRGSRWRRPSRSSSARTSRHRSFSSSSPSSPPT